MELSGILVPDELILAILADFTASETLRLGLISKQFLKLSRDRELWHRLAIRDQQVVESTPLDACYNWMEQYRSNLLAPGHMHTFLPSTCVIHQHTFIQHPKRQPITLDKTFHPSMKISAFAAGEKSVCFISGSRVFCESVNSRFRHPSAVADLEGILVVRLRGRNEVMTGVTADGRGLFWYEAEFWPSATEMSDKFDFFESVAVGVEFFPHPSPVIDVVYGGRKLIFYDSEGRLFLRAPTSKFAMEPRLTPVDSKYAKYEPIRPEDVTDDDEWHSLRDMLIKQHQESVQKRLAMAPKSLAAAAEEAGIPEPVRPADMSDDDEWDLLREKLIKKQLAAKPIQAHPSNAAPLFDLRLLTPVPYDIQLYGKIAQLTTATDYMAVVTSHGYVLAWEFTKLANLIVVTVPSKLYATKIACTDAHLYIVDQFDQLYCATSLSSSWAFQLQKLGFCVLSMHGTANMFGMITKDNCIWTREARDPTFYPYQHENESGDAPTTLQFKQFKRIYVQGNEYMQNRIYIMATT